MHIGYQPLLQCDGVYRALQRVQSVLCTTKYVTYAVMYLRIADEMWMQKACEQGSTRPMFGTQSSTKPRTILHAYSSMK